MLHAQRMRLLSLCSTLFNGINGLRPRLVSSENRGFIQKKVQNFMPSLQFGRGLVPEPPQRQRCKPRRNPGHESQSSGNGNLPVPFLRCRDCQSVRHGLLTGLVVRYKKASEKPLELAAVRGKANQRFIQLSWPGEADDWRTFT